VALTGTPGPGDRRVPAGIDVSVPNVARVYDALLGGKDNFAADRAFVEKAMRLVTPDAPLAAQANRAFLRRVVRFLAGEAGIAQFLDIGSGLPTQGNVSEVAHEVNPEAHVVYVDHDPVVCTHSKALLADSRTTDIVTADIRRPAEILGSDTVRTLIDFGRPVGLLLLAILHHVRDDEDPAGIAAALRDALPSGSYLAISSFRLPGPELMEIREKTRAIETLLTENLGTGRWRDDEEILGWFGDWEVLDPGLVPLAEWRPVLQGRTRKDDTYYTFYGAVARKP
jgi:S-adenosyl methyltransferase